ncbi:hypothetical protein [Rhizobium mesoamericanum]|uniref:Transmembrane protein n=1 Tax=Rhizobium mesoamericanum STM3625 TaxID=1211777 RepID=K0PT32_9HYPH|nr:hypothetical protein [Rhizobium mesoamericanum]CCM74525.1 hypothetical protein BN77_1659 [Rhizobium mesoamericanum STM3625]
MVNRLSHLLIVAGGVGLAVSYVWWYIFYSQVMQFLDANGELPDECIYTIGDPCSMVSSAANAFGATAYDPRLFWGAAGAVAIGVILGILPDASEDDDYRPR